MTTYAFSPVFSDGDLVYPQTMQAIVQHAAYQLHRRVQCTRGDACGLVRSELDLEALGAGELVFRDLCAVLPSGQLLDTSASLPIPARRAPALTPGGPPVRVWVGLTREREGAPNCGGEQSSVVRYIREERALADWTAGQRRVKVTLARPNVQVRFDEEADLDFDGLPVLELVRDAEGRLRCVDDFVPPALTCAAAPALTRRVDALLALAQSRSDDLLHHWSLSRGAPAALTALDVVVKAVHAALSGAVPVLRAIRRAPGRTTPFELHLHLLRLAGEMAALTGDDAPLDTLPVYDEGDLRGSFAPLWKRLHVLLQRSIYDNFICAPFAQVHGDPRAFALHFEDPRVALADKFLLRMHLSDDHGRVVLGQDRQIQHLIRQAKLGTPDQQELFKQLNLGGVHLENASAIPGLPVHSGCGYFHLDRGDKRFQAVLAQRSALLRFPDGFELPTSPRPHFALIAVLSPSG